MRKGIILAGGSGTRLWPLSRKSYPKQFVPLVGDATLFQAVARRLSGATDDFVFTRPMVLTNAMFRFIIAEGRARKGAVELIELFAAGGVDVQCQAQVLATARWPQFDPGRVKSGVKLFGHVRDGVDKSVDLEPHDFDGEHAGVLDQAVAARVGGVLAHAQIVTAAKHPKRQPKYPTRGWGSI